jgi:hypothetical protein
MESEEFQWLVAKTILCIFVVNVAMRLRFILPVKEELAQNVPGLGVVRWWKCICR